MHDAVTTFLFTDIEGSTRLWEQEPERMRHALARHDAILRGAVESHGGTVVKLTGDGVHAAFADVLAAVHATVGIQQALGDPAATAGIALRVRCGLHAGLTEGRDGDYYGSVVNRAARIMSAAHGGQMLVSRTVAERLNGSLPRGVGLRDLGSVRLRDLSTPEHVFQLVHPALRSDFPALRSLEETPNNLPHQFTSFIGREREVAQIKSLLQKSRLVSIIGMGGIGKTRLAIHAAADLLDEFPDGVWLVELASVRDAQRVEQAVASVLGIKDDGALGVSEALVAALKQRKALLMLDNCEHLGQACAELVKHLLAGAPQLHVLSSSREPLHVAGETTFLLSPLPTPDLRAGFDPVSLAQFAAVRLFVDRASAALAGFALTAATATEVAAICHRLDGIPLAIELAGARLRTASPQQIAARLDDRFRVLAKGNKAALPRQQTLRATIDWSHDLLSEDERALFRTLSVFAGGWTLEAAEAVCAGEAPHDEDVMDVLAQLVEKSLVLLDRDDGRYRFLETVRQYAGERLDSAGAAGAARARHFGYFLELAKLAKPALVGPDQADWLARLDAERENILAAHAWAGESADRSESGLVLSNAMKMYWLNRGLLELGRRVAAEALSRPGIEGFARCRALFDAGQLAYFSGRYAEARRQLEESLAIARGVEKPRAVAAVLQPLGMAAFAQGDRPKAREYLEEALAMARDHGDPRELAAALNALAQLLLLEGRRTEAAAHFSRALEIAAELEDRESIAVALLNVAMVSLDSADAGACRQQVARALAIAEHLVSSRVTQSVLEVCAGLAAAQGEWQQCARFYGAAESQARRTGLRRDPADEAFLEPLLGRARRAAGEPQFAGWQAEAESLLLPAITEEARRFLTRS